MRVCQLYGRLTYVKRTTIYIEEEVHLALQKLSSYRVSFSEHIRRALDRYIRDMGTEPVSNESTEDVDGSVEGESNDNL